MCKRNEKINGVSTCKIWNDWVGNVGLAGRIPVGIDTGDWEGTGVGDRVGMTDGTTDVRAVGMTVGTTDWAADGRGVEMTVGTSDGITKRIDGTNMITETIIKIVQGKVKTQKIKE